MQNGRRKTDKKLDEALENTFPSSDPVSISRPDTGTGSPKEDRQSAGQSVKGTAQSVKDTARKTARSIRHGARRIETRARAARDRAASKLSELIGRPH
jgi:hypothetical protein